jgi:hypothetical protein
MKHSLKTAGVLLAGLLALASASQAAPLKFDFGTPQSPVFPGFTRVSEETLFNDNAAFGFVNAVPASTDRVRPNALAGDFILSKGKVTFRVNLPDGDYKAWFMYGDSRYGARVIVPLAQKNAISINGKEAFADPITDWKEFYTEKYYFRGYSDVYHAGDDFYDKYIAPDFKEATVAFTVTGGKALFTLEDIPLAAMVVYPVGEATQVEDDIDYLHSELRRYTIAKEAKPENLNPEPEYSQLDKQRGYVVYSRFPSSPPFAQDRPLAEEMKNPTPSAFLSAGQKANLSVTVLPLTDLKNVKVSVSDLTDKVSGKKIAASAIKIERIAHQAITRDPKIGTLKTATYTYEIAPEFIKPFNGDFALMDKGVNRTFLLTVDADGSTPAGVYEGTVTIAPQGAPAQQVPVRVRVLPITLPELPIVAGRYAMDYDFYYYYYWVKVFPDDSFRDYVWAREKQNMQWMKEMGLNSIAWTDARPGDITQNPSAPLNEQFVRWMDLYRDMGFKAMPWYGFQAISSSKRTFPEHERFSPEWTKEYRAMIGKIRDIGQERKWPEIVFYLSDELSNDGAEGGADGLKRAEASKDIPGIRRISSVNGKFEQPMIGKLEILMPNFAFPITQPILDEMKAKNTELWLYNVTDQRFTWGYYPFRTGAKGRFQWFGNYGPGYPFDDFDSTAGNTTWDAFVNGPDGPVGMINALDMRDGLDDLRYVTLLKQLVEKAKNPQAKAVSDGKAILAEIAALDVDLRNYAGNTMSAQDTGFAASDKLWSPEKCERMRWRIAEAIMALQK